VGRARVVSTPDPWPMTPNPERTESQAQQDCTPTVPEQRPRRCHPPPQTLPASRSCRPHSDGCESVVARVDRLAVVRDEVKRLDAEERSLTASVKDALRAAGIDRVAARTATATPGSRTTATIDPALLFIKAGDRAFECMTVRVEAARMILSGADLAEISRSTVTPVAPRRADQQRGSGITRAAQRRGCRPGPGVPTAHEEEAPHARS